MSKDADAHDQVRYDSRFLHSALPKGIYKEIDAVFKRNNAKAGQVVVSQLEQGAGAFEPLLIIKLAEVQRK